eukprot:14395583-Ditylum_brightwellii.AAC.1
MSSAEQESKNAESTTVLANNAIISSIHGSKEDLDIAMNASNEQCSTIEDNDDGIHSQSNSSNELTTLEGNVTPTIMPLSTIDDETSDVLTQTDNDNTLQMANITT